MLQEITIEITNTAQLFHWKGYGLKLNIPPQSLPCGVNSCTITIMASLSGQYQFPAGKNLVSPVFWLKCEPSVNFLKELDLEIEHCARLENTSHLFMVRGICTQKELPYSFKLLRDGRSNFSKYSSYGVIALNSFSGYAVVDDHEEPNRKYLSYVFYMGPYIKRKIHFTVTWHLNAHITVS